MKKKTKNVPSIEGLHIRQTSSGIVPNGTGARAQHGNDAYLPLTPCTRSMCAKLFARDESVKRNATTTTVFHSLGGDIRAMKCTFQMPLSVCGNVAHGFGLMRITVIASGSNK